MLKESFQWAFAADGEECAGVISLSLFFFPFFLFLSAVHGRGKEVFGVCMLVLEGGNILPLLGVDLESVCVCVYAYVRMT